MTDRTRQPLADATVQLVRDLPRYWLPMEVAPLAEARTDSAGRFRLEADIPGDTPVVLLASAPGHRLTRFPYDPVKSTQMVGLPLQSGSSIRGKVLDQQNQPIEGAVIGPLIASAETAPQTAGRIPPQWTRSAPDGSFMFEGVMPDVEHHFLVRAEGFEMADVAASPGAPELSLRLYPGGSRITGEITSAGQPGSAHSGMKVRFNGNGFDEVVAADESGRFEISGIPSGEYSLEPMPSGERARRVALVTLPEHAGTTWTLEITSGYSISGLAVDAETSTPVAGVALRINETETSEGRKAVSGPDGSFHAGPFFVAGAPRIKVLPESGFVSVADLGEAPTDYPATDGFSDLHGVDVQVRRKRVLAIELAGFDQTTQPVLLSLTGPVGGRGRVQRATATTAGLEMVVHTAGEYRLWGHSGGLATNLATVPVTDEARIPVRLHIGPAASLAGRVVVKTADGSTTRATGYSVRVLAPAVTAGSTESETVLIREGGDQAELAGRLIAEVPTLAADGSFSFSVLPAGGLVVEAQNKSATRRKARDLNLEAGAAETVNFEFEAGKALAGRIVTRDNRPIPAAVVRIRLRGGAAGAGREIALEANEHGNFRVDDAEADVAETLYVDFHGFVPKRIGPFELPAEKIEIVLDKRGLLRARVEDAPASRWKIYLMAAEPWRRGTHPEQFMSRPAESPAEVTGGEETEFRVPDAGRFRVVAVGEGGRLAVSDPFAWAAGDETDREVVVTPDAAGTLTGTFEGSGAAEVTAWNTALPEQAGAKAEFKSEGSNGNFSFSGLPPGDYLVIAAGDSVYASAANVQVTAGGVTNVALESDSGGAPVTGVVRMGEKAVAGADLELVSQTDPTAVVHKTRSSNEGTFVFDTVPADEYLVRATAATDAGEIKGQRSVTVPRRGDAPAVDLNIQPARAVSVPVAQLSQLGITAGTDVFFLNRESRDLIKATWTNSGELQGELPAGSYDVWRGDETIGAAEVTAEGGVSLKPLEPGQ